MKCLVSLFLLVSLLPAIAFAQTNGVVKICREVAIPNGYVVVGYEPSAVCPNGAYVLKREGAPAPGAVSRPRKIGDRYLDAAASALDGDAAELREPRLQTSPAAVPLDAPETPEKPAVEEVGDGEVIRIDTNLVTVPVSVLDRQGRSIFDLRREQFRVFENGVEQQVVHF